MTVVYDKSTVIPAAIIMVNPVSDNVKAMLTKQLFIDAVVDGATFDLLADGYVTDIADGYSDIRDYILKNNLRLMVERSYQETQNRNLVDVAIYFKNGLAAIEENKFGPHGFTYPVVNLSWDKLGIEEANRSIL